MVLDSPFSDLVDLMMDLVDTYRVRLPKFTVSALYFLIEMRILFIELIQPKLLIYNLIHILMLLDV